MTKTKLEAWIEDNLKEDYDTNMQLAKIANEELHRELLIQVKTPELLIAIYGITFQTILEDVLAKRSDGKKEYSLVIPNTFEIGYTDGEKNDEYEKIGSFVPFMFDVEKNDDKSTLDDDDQASLSTVERCTAWSSKNLIERPKILKDIPNHAVANIKDVLGRALENPVLILPMFCITHRCIIKTAMRKLADSKEDFIRIQIAGAYDIIATKDKDGIIIEYSPIIESKLDTKSDMKATSEYE